MSLEEDVLPKIFPAPWFPYLKAVIAAIGSAVTVAAATYPAISGNHYWVLGTTLLTALGVYAVPNVSHDASAPPVSRLVTDMFNDWQRERLAAQAAHGVEVTPFDQPAYDASATSVDIPVVTEYMRPPAPAPVSAPVVPPEEDPPPAHLVGV